jgi:hypothetical protein
MLVLNFEYLKSFFFIDLKFGMLHLRLHSLHRWSIFVIIAQVITDNIAIDFDMCVVHAMENM